MGKGGQGMDCLPKACVCGELVADAIWYRTGQRWHYYPSTLLTKLFLYSNERLLQLFNMFGVRWMAGRMA